MSEPLVVVGNGMAATRFVDELTQRALGRYSVTRRSAPSRGSPTTAFCFRRCSRERSTRRRSS